MNRTIDSKAFDEACKKAGLNLDTTVNSTPKSGIIIKDGHGNKYTVNCDMQIEHIPTIKGAMVKKVRTNSVRIRKFSAARKITKRAKYKH